MITILKSKRQSVRILLAAGTLLLPNARANAQTEDSALTPEEPFDVALEIPVCPIENCSFWLDGTRLTQPAGGTSLTLKGTDDVSTVELRNADGRTLNFQENTLSPDILLELKPLRWATGAHFGAVIANGHPFKMDSLNGRGFSVGISAIRELATGHLSFELRRDRENRVGKKSDALVDYSNDGLAVGYGKTLALGQNSAPPFHLSWNGGVRYGRSRVTESMRSLVSGEEGNTSVVRDRTDEKGYEIGATFALTLQIPATDNVWFPVSSTFEYMHARNQTANVEKRFSRFGQSIGLTFAF